MYYTLQYCTSFHLTFAAVFLLFIATFFAASKYNSNGAGGGGGGQNSGFYNSSNYNDNHRNRNNDNNNGSAGRVSGRGRGGGRGILAAPLRSTNSNNSSGNSDSNGNSNSNSANISIGISSVPPSALSAQNSNTYDIHANVTIGIDDTVPWGGIAIPSIGVDIPLGIGPATGTIGTLNKGIKIGTNTNDPYGVGLTEKELSYVTMDNKLILFEVGSVADTAVAGFFIICLVDLCVYLSYLEQSSQVLCEQ